MKAEIIIVSIMLCLFTGKAFSQGDTIRPVAQVADTLTFSIQQVKMDSGKTRVMSAAVKPLLTYDYKYQYPYYLVESKKWQVGDHLQFHFTNLPSRGYVYVFRVDGENTVKMLPMIRIDNAAKQNFIYPDALKALRLEATGKERICLWYSTDPIAAAEKIIGGIELTMGSFVYRNNGQLGKNLLLPGFGWHLEDAKFGFVTTPRFFPLPDSFILPVIIEFDVVKKNSAAD